MRLVARQLLLVAGLTGCPALVLADMAEAPATTRSQTVQEIAGEGEATVEVDHTKPVEVHYNFTQPQAPELSAKTSNPVALLRLMRGGAEEVQPNASIEKPARTKKTRKRQRKIVAKRRQAPKSNVEQPWRELARNKAVLEFRDCLGSFAEQQSVPATAQAPRLVISSAMDDECREAFDGMARKMFRQYGKDRFGKLSGQLISQVFVPTVVRHTRIEGDSQRIASDD